LFELSEYWARVVFEGMRVDLERNQKHEEIVNEFLGGRRFFLICGGERGGKSFISAVLAALMMQPNNLDEPSKSEPDLGWIIGPDYKQTRAEFQYIVDLLEAAGWVEKRSTPENPTSPWSVVTPWHFRLETKSANDLRKIASQPPRFIIMAEAAQQPYESWLKSRSRAAQKRGHVIMSGTLEKGLPWYGDLLKRWKAPNAEGGFGISIPTWENRIEFPGGWDDPEIQLLRNSLPEDMFWERFGAEPRKATNLVIPEFDYTTHVREIEADPDIPVELWIDPGKNAYAVLFVQTIGVKTHVLDRVYKRAAIAYDVIPEAMNNSLWPLVMKNEQSHGVIDIAGKHQYGLPSHVEVWKEEAGVILRSNYVNQDTGRDVVRYRLKAKDELDKEPLLTFNSIIGDSTSPDGQAADVLSEFNLWRWRDYSPNSSESLHPIDSNNHAIKALGYGLYDKFGPVLQRKPFANRVQRSYWYTA
jgi:hypothetical protein